METTKFYTLSGQPIILMPEKKGKHKGRINIMQIFNMGYADWQTTPGGNVIILTRPQIIAIARQLNPDSKEAIIKPDQREQQKAIILAEAAKYGID